MTNEIPDNWYERFFSGINCEFWEKAVIPEWTKLETEFLLQEMDLKKGDTVLDIPCGYGRHAIELSKKGFPVTGVDISTTFIEKLIKNASAQALPVHCIREDILKVALKEKFAGAICLGNSFGYFNEDKMRIFTGKVSQCLLPGAKWIINTAMLAESILPNLSALAKRKTYTAKDITMQVENNYRPDDRCMISYLTYNKGVLEERHSFKHYVFSLNEIIRLLRSNKLEVTDIFNSISRDSYRQGDPQAYIIATRL
jgi:cyclopropane fatty-acyl-phospholipid synthase-like methyltransferase